MKGLLSNLPTAGAAGAVVLGLGLALAAAGGNAAPAAQQRAEVGPPGDGGGQREAAAAAGPREQLLSALRAALDGLSTLRNELATVRRQNFDLRSAQAEDAITITALKAELTQARAEAEQLRGELEQSWQWIEELNAVLTDVRTARDEAQAALAAAATPRDGDAGEADVEDGGGVVGTVAAAKAEGPAAAERLLAALDRRRGLLSDAGGGDVVPAVPVVADAATGYRAAATAPVNLRSAPRNASDVLTVVGKGHVVRVVGRDGGWRRVEYTDPLSRQFTGWVHGSFLDRARPERAHADAALSREEG